MGMTAERYRFDRFVLDPHDRQLTHDGAVVELSSRYLDALALLARESGKLVTKDRFMEDIWRGIPVTDEALTQCIRSLRKALGDDASNPRFIETVPKHGYRFIAGVESDVAAAGSENAAPYAAPIAPAAISDGGAAKPWASTFLLAGAGTLGGAFAGLIGGFVYGFASTSQAVGAGVGESSVLVVLIALCLFVSLVGGAGVGLGVALAKRISGKPWGWAVVGGALGGLVTGGFAKLIGMDVFTLLLGRAPGDITGAGEGALIGAAVGLGLWIAQRWPGPVSASRAAVASALTTAAAGEVIALTGGQMMAGSLSELAVQFPDSRLRIDQVGALFGENGFGLISRLVTGGLEGALFGGCVAGMLVLAWKRMERADG